MCATEKPGGLRLGNMRASDGCQEIPLLRGQCSRELWSDIQMMHARGSWTAFEYSMYCELVQESNL